MRLFLLASLFILTASGVQAQEGFEADRFFPCLNGGSQVSACAPIIHRGRVSLMGSADLAHHLLRLENQASGTDWIVSRRLNLRLAANWAPTDQVRLELGMDGVPRQSGKQLDSLGAPIRLKADLGRLWLSALWAPTIFNSGLINIGFLSRLVYPLGAPAALTAPRDLAWHLELWLSTQLWWFRPSLNLGLALQERTRFRDLIRDDDLIGRLGLAVKGPSWPVSASIELYTITRLNAPFARRVDDTVELLGGLHLEQLEDLRLGLVAGAGLVGPASPGWRIMTVVGWRTKSQKRPVYGE